MSRSLTTSPPSLASVLARLLDTPDLVHAVRALPGRQFASLVREIGIEDAGEIVALATTEQLVAAFDADLFVNERPGERETFDPDRFVTWLEILMEAGDGVVAGRISELSEDFVAHALSSLMLVLDNDALMLRLGEGDDDALRANKAIESSLAEEIDGYLLVSRRTGGWNAALALVLALDRDNREFLVPVLDRCAAGASRYVDDLEALAGVLDTAESLAEDVEAEREDRRSRQGYVEPRAAKSFLALAMRPAPGKAPAPLGRDPITHAYFRQLQRPRLTEERPSATAAKALGWLEAGGHLPRTTGLLPSLQVGEAPSGGAARFIEAMRTLNATDPPRFGARLEELAYLTNVVLSGADLDGRRFRQAEAADAVLATVALGAELAALGPGLPTPTTNSVSRATVTDLVGVLRDRPADVLFRRALAITSERKLVTRSPAVLRSDVELAAALEALGIG